MQNEEAAANEDELGVIAQLKYVLRTSSDVDREKGIERNQKQKIVVFHSGQIFYIENNLWNQT